MRFLSLSILLVLTVISCKTVNQETNSSVNSATTKEKICLPDSDVENFLGPVKSVTIVKGDFGSTFAPRDYRVRFFNAEGEQIETGLCQDYGNGLTKCFGREEITWDHIDPVFDIFGIDFDKRKFDMIIVPVDEKQDSSQAVKFHCELKKDN